MGENIRPESLITIGPENCQNSFQWTNRIASESWCGMRPWRRAFQWRAWGDGEI